MKLGDDGTPGTSVNETIGVSTGTPAGATAAAADTYRFLGWFDNADCTGDPISTAAKYVPAKNAQGLYEEATYYAKFAYATTTLTITNASGHDAIFTVSGKGYGGNGESTSALRIAIPNGQSVTIGGVYVGETYSVVEEGGWSWRYNTAQSHPTQTLVAADNFYSVPAASPVITKWLSGTSWDRKSKTLHVIAPSGG